VIPVAGQQRGPLGVGSIYERKKRRGKNRARSQKTPSIGEKALPLFELHRSREKRITTACKKGKKKRRGEGMLEKKRRINQEGTPRKGEHMGTPWDICND